MADLFSLPLHVIPWAVVIGAGVGFLSGLFGVGGGFLLTPLVNTFLGVSFPVTAGSGLAQIIGTAGAAVLRHRTHGHRLAWRRALTLLGGMIVGIFAGNVAMEGMKGRMAFLLGRTVSVTEAVLPACFAAVLLVLAAVVWAETRSTERGGAADGARRGFLARIPIGPYLPVSGVSAPGVFLLGCLIGPLQSLFGIGGGVVMLPALVYLVGLSTHAAVTTSLFVVFLTSLVGTAQKAWLGDVNLALVMSLLVASTFGAQLGAGLSKRLPGVRLRRYFVLVVLVGVAVVGYKVWKVLRGWTPPEPEGASLSRPERLLHVGLCLALPILWALASYWLFGRLRRGRDQGAGASGASDGSPSSSPGAGAG